MRRQPSNGRGNRSRPPSARTRARSSSPPGRPRPTTSPSRARRAFRRDRGRHIVTAASEHKAVLDVLEALAFQGWEITRVAPESDGRVSPETVAAALRADTVLVSIMHANNETGVINDIDAIGAVAHDHGALYHVDAAQTGGKLALDVGAQAVDLVSLSAHKAYGPKGVGALWVRRRPRVRLVPQMHGGGHERGLRSGTLPTHQVVGMGEAFALAQPRRTEDAAHAEALLARLHAGLGDVEDLRENGDGAPRLPHIRSLAFGGVEGESLAAALGDRVALATGSACTTASLEPSFVLRAMGQGHARAAEAVRLSWGRFTTADEIDAAAAAIADTVRRLRTAERAAAG
ncbi:MAG: aminotransferase class V-fold PLP-dependent enzyme [Halofilum sp. (in: g-proteobacteria)]|nr:aminotransferase class V-fold PLP-dependent enzyme [Halofilum sp. (in: g-proteobacteria)]